MRVGPGSRLAHGREARGGPGRNASQFPALVWCPAVARADSGRSCSKAAAAVGRGAAMLRDDVAWALLLCVTP